MPEGRENNNISPIFSKAKKHCYWTLQFSGRGFGWKPSQLCLNSMTSPEQVQIAPNRHFFSVPRNHPCRGYCSSPVFLFLEKNVCVLYFFRFWENIFGWPIIFRLIFWKIVKIHWKNEVYAKKYKKIACGGLKWKKTTNILSKTLFFGPKSPPKGAKNVGTENV